MKKVEKIILSLVLLLSLACVGIFTVSATETETLTVSSLSVKNSEDGVFLKWSTCDTAEEYKIYRKSGSDGYKVLAQVTPDIITYTDPKVSSGKNYTYKVTPCTAETEGVCASEASINFVAVPKITKLRNYNAGITVTWKSVGSAEKYQVYRKAATEDTWKKLTTVKNTVTSYNDTTAKNNTSYSYRVRAKIGSDYSAWVYKDISCISSPQITLIRNRGTGIEVKWSAVEGAKNYLVIRKAPKEDWKTLQTLSAKTKKFIDTTVKPDVKYQYAVRVKNDKALSGFFSGTYYKYLTPPKVSSAQNALGGVKVKWKEVSSATGYKLYRKSETQDSWHRIAILNSKGSTSYTDTKAQSGTKYSYTLIVVSGKYQSAYRTDGVSVNYVAAPKKVTVKKQNSANVITWEKSKGATNYEIYRKGISASEWTKLATVKNTAKYTDSTAKNGTVYYYRLRAVMKGKYYSAYSESVKSSRIDPTKKMIALTYDDGPSSTYTNRILDVLEKYDSKATFFVIGSRVDRYHDALERAHKMGCEIGNHTYNHINLPSYSDSSILDEVNRTNAVIKKYTGVTPKIIRAPGGATSSRVLSTVNMPFIYWSIDTRDWEHRNASRTVSIIKSNVRDGSIILMHDIYSPTASASESVIPWLINQGYQLVTLSELMEYRGIDMRAGKIYYNAYK